MALSDYQPLTETVQLRGTSVTVRGINLEDVSVLINEHFSDADKIFSLYDEASGSGQADIAAAVIVRLIQQAPSLAAHLISLASDEPENREHARKLSLIHQVELLKTIANLTFEEAGGARKFVEGLTTLLPNLVPVRPMTGSLT